MSSGKQTTNWFPTGVFDLSPLDYFLFSRLSSNVFVNKPKGILCIRERNKQAEDPELNTAGTQLMISSME